MLRSKLVGTSVAVAMLAMVFAGCSKKAVAADEKTTLKALPKSGAEKFVDSKEVADAVIMEIYAGIMADPGVTAAGTALTAVKPESIKPDFEKLAEGIAAKVDSFGTNFAAGKDENFNKKGETSLVINEKVGKVEGLPEGVSLTVSDIAAKANVKANKKDGSLKADVSASTGYELVFDTVKLVGKDAATASVIKGIFSAANVDVKAGATGKAEDTSDYNKMLASANPDSTALNVDSSVTVSAGVSFLSTSKIGGRVVAALTVTAKEDALTYEKAMAVAEAAEKVFYALERGRDIDQKALTSLPVNVNASIKFFDDAGKETFTYYNADLPELVNTVAAYLPMLEELGKYF